MKKYLIIIALFLTLTNPVYSSEITGTISTGISTGDGLNGLVIEPPVANPTSGVYSSTQSVSLSGGPGTVSIRYTTDGSDVNCSTGNQYSGPISISSSTSIKAISCYPNGIASPSVVFAYAINPPSAPIISGGGGGGGGTPIILDTPPYDFNSDGNIDILDFNILIVNWGSTTATDKSMGDANGDGKVDIFDFNLLIINWQ